MSTLELIHSNLPCGPFRLALFDFDGTLSLIREGWPNVMAGLVREVLGGDDPDIIDEIVIGLNGRPAIAQMARLTEVVAARGGTPRSAAEYHASYQERLRAKTSGRYDALTAGRVSSSEWAVAGAHAFLATLRERGIGVALASGTAMEHVRRELALLHLDTFFGDVVFAPHGDDASFSKRDIIAHLLTERGLRGDALIGFGDGVVETEEVKRVGGVAVAVASQEPPARGVNAAKRERLIRAGADAVIADYTEPESLATWLFGPA